MNLSCATDIPGIRERLANFHVPGSDELLKNYVAAPSDVFIATYPKCGTTLMQQIVHGLRTEGDMEFREISEVVPWIEAILDLDQHPDDPQKARPHAFKSHLCYERLPVGARYIHVTRDPCDVAVSFYHFFSGWVFEPGAIDIETFVLKFLLDGSNSGRYCDHVVSWWPRLGEDDTLIIAFEDLIADLPAMVKKVAAFADIEISQKSLEKVISQSSIEFMKAHSRQFDDHLIRDARNVSAGLPADASTTKVRQGTAGRHRAELPKHVIDALQDQWQQIVLPVTGLRQYSDYRMAIRERNIL